MTITRGQHRSSFTVAADHPALPGHFPGSPVVPGVVVLDQVLRASEVCRQRAVSVVGLRQVKFHAPLLPGERADVALELAADALSFRVTRDAQLIAQGTFMLARDAKRS
jgi:3-hydroxymyristoyl/3-hydroxydecanoyl-(acyl carrier protein) dehydratase